MIAVDGLRDGQAKITVGGESQTSAINNGVAIFRSTTLPFDHEGEIEIQLRNAANRTCVYRRTLLEAGTYHGHFQHQFLIGISTGPRMNSSKSPKLFRGGH